MTERNRGIKKLCSFVGERIKKTKVGGYISKKLGNFMKSKLLFLASFIACIVLRSHSAYMKPEKLITYCSPDAGEFSKIPF
jgi:hypothetical protein